MNPTAFRGMLSVKRLSLGFGGNGGEVTEIVVFAAVGDGFEVFRITTVGNADTGNLPLFCHVDCLLFLYNRIVGKLIPGDPAALLHKTDDPLCVGIGARNLIQCLLYKFLTIHVHHSFCIVFAVKQRICGVYKMETGMV